MWFSSLSNNFLTNLFYTLIIQLNYNNAAHLMRIALEIINIYMTVQENVAAMAVDIIPPATSFIINWVNSFVSSRDDENPSLLARDCFL